jgi:glycosyltransferase involved in cell wall biosynthesis
LEIFIRILITTSNLSIVGGAQTHIQALLPALVEAGHVVAVLHEDVETAPGATIVDQVPGIMTWRIAKINKRQVLDQIESWKPDIAYNHGMNDLVTETEIVRRWPTFLFVHSSSGTCISGTKRWRRPRLAICERVFGPACLGLYLPLGCGGNNPLTMLKWYKRAQSKRRLLKDYKGIFVASDFMAQDYYRHGITAGLLHLVPYFSPGCQPDFEPPHGRAFTQRIIFAGRLVRDKGWQHALAATSLAARSLGRDLRLVVAGDGADLPKMRRIVANEDIGIKLEFLGWIDRQAMQLEMRQADLLLMPSLWAEPFGLLGIEAGCVGLPAAGYSVGGIPDWLVPGETGESGSSGQMVVAELAAAIERALNDQDHWQKLRVGAWKKAQEFSKARHINQLNQLFETYKS